MKQYFTFLLLMCFTHIIKSQDLTPKIFEDSNKTRYFAFTIEQSKKIASKIKEGEICNERADILEKHLELLKTKNETCDTLVDSLLINDKQNRQIIENQSKIIENNEKQIGLYVENGKKYDEIIKKQQKTLNRKNRMITTLTVTNLVAVIVLLILF